MASAFRCTARGDGCRPVLCVPRWRQRSCRQIQPYQRTRIPIPRCLHGLERVPAFAACSYPAVAARTGLPDVDSPGEVVLMSENTVNFHLKKAMRKLGTTSRTVAVVKAIRLNLIELP